MIKDHSKNAEEEVTADLLSKYHELLYIWYFCSINQ